MLVPVEWLREYVDFDLPAEELAEKLTLSGLEVEEISLVEGQKVFSTYVTPNRPDQLSVVGVAREVSALLGTAFKPPKPEFSEGDTQASKLVTVDIESPVNCPRYSARVITETKVTQSPAWMQKKLMEAGMRPINNVVDSTNYVLMELGQPLHAFDCDLVADHRIIVRQANPGEKITTIDGEERILDPEMLVIADPKHAVAIAGVMGGFDSEVSWSTKNILLESAHFNRLSIRRSARALGMSTEASYRFERHVDPELTIFALDRVAELIQKTGGGTIAKGIVDNYPKKAKQVALSIRPKRASLVLGIEVTPEEVQDYLGRLGLEVLGRENGRIIVKAPTFRPDIEREEDLIEEVGRLYGYDRIPAKLPSGVTPQGKDSPEGAFASRISKILLSSGLQEVVTGSMTGPLGGEVAIRNPLNEELGRLRKQLVLDLLSVISYNASRGIRDTGLFQIGRVFESQDESIIVEKLSVGGALMGSMWDDGWNVDHASLRSDFFLCKGIVQNLVDRLDIPDVLFKPAEMETFHPTRAAVIEAGGDQIGVIGEVNSDLAEMLGLPDRVYAFELDIEALMEKSIGVKTYKPISRYPAVTRDLAVVVAEDTPYRQVEELLTKGAGDLLESLSLFDVYAGPPLIVGRKSLAFSIVFRSHERTLRDEEVDERLGSIRSLLESELGATFRDT